MPPGEEVIRIHFPGGLVTIQNQIVVLGLEQKPETVFPSGVVFFADRRASLEVLVSQRKAVSDHKSVNKTAGAGEQGCLVARK
jgi:hypothetical protein